MIFEIGVAGWEPKKLHFLVHVSGVEYICAVQVDLTQHLVTAG